jgi:hypothetical protein
VTKKSNIEEKKLEKNRYGYSYALALGSPKTSTGRMAPALVGSRQDQSRGTRVVQKLLSFVLIAKKTSFILLAKDYLSYYF